MFQLLLSLSLGATAVYAQTLSTPCSCSSGFIPVPVDVTIPVDPSNPAGLNTTDTFRLKTTFNVFGVLCEPVTSSSKFSDSIQLLLHGQTYTTQYWDVAWNGFQNYSYIAHSCNLGISSFAYDNTGAGRTTRPLNSSDCQIPTAANVSSSLARDLKSGKVSQILTGTAKQYKKVIGYGHSLGSATLNYAAIGDGANSPFDGLVLTGEVHDPQFIIQSPVVALPATQVDPVKWPNLDPGYITTPNISARFLFYGPDTSSFSPTILQLDELTKDVGSRWISAQIKFTYVPAIGFTPPVVQMVGSLDQTHCLDNNNTPCNQKTLQVQEAVFWPNSKNFTMIVIDGFGHDLNLEFAAVQAFPIMTQLFESFVN
ncbi:hypothetical protein K439DRAFT_1390513 [Ramaria rubella]|nr:hypothetical protein K439DRAFT_1390513 [Ramaria rubella]